MVVCGSWSYLLLRIGCVFTGPFLPGDSLLFVAGATAAAGVLDPWAVILGSTVGALLEILSDFSLSLDW